MQGQETRRVELGTESNSIFQSLKLHLTEMIPWGIVLHFLHLPKSTFFFNKQVWDQVEIHYGLHYFPLMRNIRVSAGVHF